MKKRPQKPPLDKVTASPQFRYFMRMLAIAGLACSVVGLLLKMKGVNSNINLLVIGMSLLAVVSLFLDQLFPYPISENNEDTGGLRPMWVFAMKLTGCAVAVTLFGLLFRIMHWSGGMLMLVVGVGSLAICAIAWLYIINKKNTIK
ncbi:MAG: hypothetical protein J6V98_07570 [Bacteroidales bacterium]|nr:hypothetical protein [Bacteroidales bacterium]